MKTIEKLELPDVFCEGMNLNRFTNKINEIIEEIDQINKFLVR